MMLLIVISYASAIKEIENFIALAVLSLNANHSLSCYFVYISMQSGIKNEMVVDIST